MKVLAQQNNFKSPFTILSSGEAKKMPVLCTVEYCQKEVLVLIRFVAKKSSVCAWFRYVWQWTNVFFRSLINIVYVLYAGFKLKANYNDIPEYCLTIYYVLVINEHYIFGLVNVININLCLYEGEHNSEFVIFLPRTETCLLDYNCTCCLEWIWRSLTLESTERLNERKMKITECYL